jgi:hypothetical protein
MSVILECFGRQVLWLDYKNFTNQLPDKNWMCLAISNSKLDSELFCHFAEESISRGITEFKGNGKLEKELHALFTQAINQMENKIDHHVINIINTRNTNQSLAQIFGQCFSPTSTSKNTISENIKIICIDFDGINRVEELKSYAKEFELGWLPSDNIKHEIWEDALGITTLKIALKRGNEFRESLDPKSKLIHTFYASTHFEAMTIYYKFMNWGEYKIDFKIDGLRNEKKIHHPIELNKKRITLFENNQPKIFKSNNS